jgi:serine/threonine protein kinase
MSKLLSQGGFGCIFYPGIKCNGNNSSSTNFATKLQVKNFTSDNEIKIGAMISDQPGYKLFFLPVISSCNINIRNVSNREISKCEIVKNYKSKYIAMDIQYIEHNTIVDIIETNQPSDIILTLFESYKYLLIGLEKLQQMNIVHFDIKLENILFLKSSNDPRIIDFGISIPIEDLNDDNMKKYFYSYSPSYYIWCIDINIINFLLHETDSNLTEADAITIATAYVASNQVLSLYSQVFIDDFLELSIVEVKKYVGIPKKNVIRELVGHSKTWDNYSLSIIYLRIINLLFPSDDKTPFIDHMKQILIENIHPDPTKRISLNNTLTRFEDIYFLGGDVSDFLSLVRHVENEKLKTTSNIRSDIEELKKIIART